MSVTALLLLAAASCPLHHRGDLVVGSPADVPPCLETVDGRLEVGLDQGVARFPELTDVTGAVELTLAGKARVELPRLERSHGGLEIRMQGSASARLPRLQHVGGPLGLDLETEASLELLPALRRLEGGLWIFGTGKMPRVLPALRRVGGTVFVKPSGPMAGLLPRLEWMGGHLVISNGGHTRVEGLAQLTTVDGGVYLFGGERFELPMLERVGGALAIRDSRFPSLAGIGAEGAHVGALLLRDNPLLERWPTHLIVPSNRIQVRGTPVEPAL